MKKNTAPIRTSLKRVLLTGASLLCITSFVNAEDHDRQDGWYFGGEFGTTIPEDNRIRTNRGLDLTDSLKLGVVGGLTAGYDKDRLRFEFAYHYRSNSYNGFNVRNPGNLGLPLGNASEANGSLKSNTISANALYNFADLEDWRLYAGVGLGLMNADANNFSATDGTSIINTDKWLATGQATFQIVKRVASDVEFGFGYRYTTTLDKDWRTRDGRAEFGPRNHDIFAKVTYHFGGSTPKRAPKPELKPEPVVQPAPVVQQAPPPPPPPAPEPVAVPIPGPFIVFFDFDESNITSQADRIIQAAAQAYKDFDVVRIETTGHADRSGPARYNLGLSERRAEAVQAALVARGVPVSNITIRFEGESDPLVVTNDGVREPQNRRVEIVLEDPDQK